MIVSVWVDLFLFFFGSMDKTAMKNNMFSIELPYKIHFVLYLVHL